MQGNVELIEMERTGGDSSRNAVRNATYRCQDAHAVPSHPTTQFSAAHLSSSCVRISRSQTAELQGAVGHLLWVQSHLYGI
jgi:hypothetical protein